jgi:hypothetical protein
VAASARRKESEPGEYSVTRNVSKNDKKFRKMPIIEAYQDT